MPSRPCVELYRGFGANAKVFIQGRAQKDRRIPQPTETTSRWRNLFAMVQRADADGVPHTKVRVSIGPFTQEFTTDDEGFFSGWMSCVKPRRLDDEWIEVTAELPGFPQSKRGTGRAFYQAGAPEYLVISDIDDTVLQSRVTNFLRAAQTLAFGNARTRLPFPGVAAFYQALRVGSTGSARNPLFYVSSSPWNLYDVITQFMEIQGIPAGPIALRDLDIDLSLLSSGRLHLHKEGHIRRILETFPDVPAILLGDSGQRDPEIYSDIVQQFPERISAIYIRNVTMNPERSVAIDALAKKVLEAGSSLVLADDTLAAAKHAAENGFISASALPAIGVEKKADEGITAQKAAAPDARKPDDEPTPTVVVE